MEEVHIFQSWSKRSTAGWSPFLTFTVTIAHTPVCIRSPRFQHKHPPSKVYPFSIRTVVHGILFAPSVEKSCDLVQCTQDPLSFWKRWIFPREAADIDMREEKGRKAGPRVAPSSHNESG